VIAKSKGTHLLLIYLLDSIPAFGLSPNSVEFRLSKFSVEEEVAVVELVEEITIYFV